MRESAGVEEPSTRTMNDPVLPCTLILLLGAPLAFFREEPVGAADLILRGGKAWTGDAAGPEAVASTGERILAAGSLAEVDQFRVSKTRVIELEGRLAVPGFIDAHVHFLDGGDELLAPELRSARSEEELADMAVLSEDILRIDPARVNEVKVDLTILWGRIVFERND